jgi:hypothetical protein
MNPKGPNQGEASAGAEAPAEKQSEQTPQRISAKMKTRIVQRLMRGESLELLAREHGTTAAKISKWRDEFLNAGEEAMKSRNGDAKDQEIARLQKKLGGNRSRGPNFLLHSFQKGLAPCNEFW